MLYKAYVETSEDALMLIGTIAKQQIEALREATNLPLVLGGASGDLNDEAYLLAHGIHIVLRGHQTFFVAMKALHDAMKHIQDGGLPSELYESAASKELQNAILRSGEFPRWQSD